ncbi:AI-2E family transporter [Woodsholea maritima]|uniref:AI-2E family transporter n=1 Tax=Woodsholea maritima TaxID=240237 RepID=UPI00035E9EDC|nr:AI-2E family transporter [Woodsholea maritima]
MSEADRVNLQRLFIITLALALSGLFLWMIRGYLSALFIAGVFTIFLMPLQSGLTGLFGGRKALAAIIVLLIAILLFLGPVLALVGIVTDQALTVADTVTPWIREQVSNFREQGFAILPTWVPFRENLIPYQDEVIAKAGEVISSFSGVMVSSLTSITGDTLSIVLKSFLMLYALFFFLTGGPGMAQKALYLVPLTEKYRALLVERVISTIRATVKGTFLIAVVQGSLTGIGLFAAGIPGAAFWGTVTAVLSIIPAVGPPLVWVPAAIYLGVQEHYVAAIGLALWGMIVVSTSDNVLRPRLVGKDAQMSDLMVLLSTLGGITLFGAVGIIVGPMIAALFSSVWYIYAQSFKGLLKETEGEDGTPAA